MARRKESTSDNVLHSRSARPPLHPQPKDQLMGFWVWTLIQSVRSGSVVKEDVPRGTLTGLTDRHVTYAILMDMMPDTNATTTPTMLISSPTDRSRVVICIFSLICAKNERIWNNCYSTCKNVDAQTFHDMQAVGHTAFTLEKHRYGNDKGLNRADIVNKVR